MLAFKKGCKCMKTYYCVGLIQVGSKMYPKLKEVDDVLGGKAAWENVDSTQGYVQSLHVFSMLNSYICMHQTGLTCYFICRALSKM